MNRLEYDDDIMPHLSNVNCEKHFYPPRNLILLIHGAGEFNERHPPGRFCDCGRAPRFALPR